MSVLTNEMRMLISQLLPLLETADDPYAAAEAAAEWILSVVE